MTTNSEAIEIAQSWSSNLGGTFNQIWSKIVAFLPSLLGGILILVLGYFIALLLKIAGAKLLEKLGMNKFCQRAGLQKRMTQLGITGEASDIFGKLLFWIVLLLALMTSVEILGLTRASDILDAIIQYLPKVLAAVLLLFAGLLVADFLRKTVAGGAEGIGIDYSRTLGQLVYWFVVVVAVSLSIAQLELETTLINRIVVIALATIGAILALALGLGLRVISNNIVSGVYARDLFKVGMWLEIEGEKAKVIGVGSTTTCLEKTNGKLRFVPNGWLMERLVDEASEEE